MQLFNVIYRTLFFYFFVTFAYRIMGKREVGQLGIIDLIVSILIAELVAISIENSSDSIALTIIPISLLVIIEIVFGFISMKSNLFRKIVQGKPTMIICQGKINYHQMLKQRYSLDDLMLNLRLKDIDSILDVEYAFLESNGKLSIFKYNNKSNKKSFPLPIIIDGKFEDVSLNHLSISRNEIIKIILDNEIELDNIFYCFFKNGKFFVILKDKQKSFLDHKYLKKQQI